jgi:hypothetical protein
VSAVEHLVLRLAAAQAHAGFLAAEIAELATHREVTAADLKRIAELATASESAALKLHAADVLDAAARRWPNSGREMVPRSSVRDRLNEWSIVERLQAERIMEKAFVA